MSAYVPVNPDDYMWQTDNPGRITKVTTYGFSTPDGVRCTFYEQGAACAGNNLPSIPPLCEPPKRNYGASEISTDTGIREVGLPCDNKSQGKVLPPFHTLTVYGVTCGVDDKKTTACKDPQGRGFVLSQHGSGWLPHI